MIPNCNGHRSQCPDTSDDDTVSCVHVPLTGLEATLHCFLHYAPQTRS